MEFLDVLVIGFSEALTPTNLLFCFIGALLGPLIGVLPEIGPTATVAILLPVTFFLPPLGALIMLAGIFYGLSMGGPPLPSWSTFRARHPRWSPP